MKKSFYTFLLLIIFAPTALAHFESPHQSFWHEPMHFIIDHYFALMLIAVGIVAVAISLRKKSKKNNAKIK
ncbi:hypothetical protein JXD20_01145 [Candidatus Peregrinibacteria bacterium]|nr:hypothetical protein [Candidatus Peregrinibacteria bacterium]